MQRILTVVNIDFLDQEPLLFHSSNSCYPDDAEWTPFKTHYFSENLVTSGIKPRISESLAKNSDH
jgi:hypothetical protein